MGSAFFFVLTSCSISLHCCCSSSFLYFLGVVVHDGFNAWFPLSLHLVSVCLSSRVAGGGVCPRCVWVAVESLQSLGPLVGDDDDGEEEENPMIWLTNEV